jgi:quercetin dioxygenase-like cupin family protein
MAFTINESAVAAQPIGQGIARQQLLTDAQAKGTRIVLDRLTLKPGASATYQPAARTIAWLQLLDGEATLRTQYDKAVMVDGYSAVMSGEFTVTLTTEKGACLLQAEVPDNRPADPNGLAPIPVFMGIDWTREPVFESESDTRKRIRIVDPENSATDAMVAEMVLYPAGSVAPKFHHLGADTLLYVCAGRGAVSMDGQSKPVGQGDMVYLADGEWHSIRAAEDHDMRFLTVRAPGRFKTVRADQGRPSAWRITSCDIHGRMPQRIAQARNYFGNTP